LAPDYQHIGDHSETVRVEYDPAVISYEELLAVFWESHDPTSSPYLNQYRNAVFALNEQQRLLAVQSREQLQKQTGRPVQTAIEPVSVFTEAEDYHQKHYLRRAENLLSELRGRYPDQQQLLASTAATRLNGYLGCNGEPEKLGPGIAALGLSPAAQHQLLEYLTLTCREFRGVGCALPSGQ
jgi:hypothetical protein